MLRSGGQRLLQIVGGGGDLGPRQRHARLRHQRVGAQHGLRLDAGRPPVLLLGVIVAGGGGGGGNGRLDVRRRVGGERHGRHGARKRLRSFRRRGRVGLGRCRGSRRSGQVLEGVRVVGVDLQQPFIGLAGEGRARELLGVELGEPREDRLLLPRAACHHLDLALEHLGQAVEVSGIDAERLQRLQRLGRRRIERHRPLEQHACVGRQLQPLAQDLGGGHQRPGPFDLAGADARIVGGGDQRPRRRVRIAVAGEELDQPAPGGADQRSGHRVVDADAQRSERPFLLADLLVGGGQQMRHLGADRAGGRRIERAPERRHLIGVVGREIERLGLRGGAPPHGDATRGDPNHAEAQGAAVGEPESVGDQDLVERRCQRIDLERRFSGHGRAEDRRQHRAHIRGARLSTVDRDAELAPVAGVEREARRDGGRSVAAVAAPGEHQPPWLESNGKRLARNLARMIAGRQLGCGQPALQPRAIDDQRGGTQEPAPVAQLGDRERPACPRPLDLEALDQDRPEIAGGDRQDCPAIHQGEGHRRRGVGHCLFLSLRTVGEGRRARTPVSRRRRRT